MAGFAGGLVVLRRVAVSANGKGGSGRIDWEQAEDPDEVALSAPVTRQSWRLAGDTQTGAGRLEGLEGGTREGSNAADLLRQATGWDIPVASMVHWARGLADPTAGVEGLEYDTQGRLRALSQHGWRVDYLTGSRPRAHDPSCLQPGGGASRRRGGEACRRSVADGPAVSLFPAEKKARPWGRPPPSSTSHCRSPGRRADGYQRLLQTVFRLLAWGDRHPPASPVPTGRSDGSGPQFPGVAEDDDLVIKAAKLLQKFAKSGQGADIGVEKRIPAGGGFGWRIVRRRDGAGGAGPSVGL